MPDPVDTLCQIIAQELHRNKNINTPELIDYVNEKISQDPELEDALISDPRIQQINRDNSRVISFSREPKDARVSG